MFEPVKPAEPDTSIKTLEQMEAAKSLNETPASSGTTGRRGIPYTPRPDGSPSIDDPDGFAARRD